MNKVFLIGNLTKDPELSVTNSGVSVCRLTIAVSRTFKNPEGERETDFFNIIAWRGLADNCNKFLKKGNKVSVVGSIQNRTFEGNDGVKKYYTEISADDIEFLTPKNSDDEGRNFKDNNNKKEVSSLEQIDDDSLPF